MEVTEALTYQATGSYEVSIKRISGGAALLAYRNKSLDLWRDGATFCRPKRGVYRSLNTVSYLRNEEVRFADFCIAEGNVVCQ